MIEARERAGKLFLASFDAAGPWSGQFICIRHVSSFREGMPATIIVPI